MFAEDTAGRPPPPPFPSQSPPPSYPMEQGPLSVEKLMRMVSYTVHAETDYFLAQRECNRVLEGELHRQQEHRRDALRELEELEHAIGALQSVYDEQEDLLQALGAAA